MVAKILVVDDEEHVRFFLERLLVRDGYKVTAVADGEAALARIEIEEFDLALLDVMMPGISGMDVLTKLRAKWPQTAVILLTAHASVDTAVTALRQDAHDYLFKPCDAVTLRKSVREGLQKRQQLRQQQSVLQQLESHLLNSLSQVRAAVSGEPMGDTTAETAPLADRFLQKGNVRMDLARHLLTFNGQLVELSPIEFDLMAHLLRQSPRVVPPQELVQSVQGYESDPWEASEVIRAHVYRIRQKMKKVGGKTADVIQTVRGVGYTIQE